MTGLASYLQMGGYADFVWPAYGLAAVALILLAALSYGSAKGRARELKKRQAQSPHRQRREQDREADDGR